MHIDWSTLALQTINALVLVWLLARYLFRPVADFVAKRQEAARKLLDDANAARLGAEAERAAARREAERIAGARADALKEVDVQAAAEKATLLASAHAEADKLRTDAAAEIEARRAALAHSENERATRLAVDIATKLLDRLPDSARVAGFIDGIVAALAQLPDAARAELGADGSPLKLTAPRALTPQEHETCRAALAASLARPVAIDVRVDPALVAGLELDAAHVLVHNSLRQDLARIEAALLNDNEAPA